MDGHVFRCTRPAQDSTQYTRYFEWLTEAQCHTKQVKLRVLHEGAEISALVRPPIGMEEEEPGSPPGGSAAPLGRGGRTHLGCTRGGISARGGPQVRSRGPSDNRPEFRGVRTFVFGPTAKRRLGASSGSAPKGALETPDAPKSGAGGVCRVARTSACKARCVTSSRFSSADLSAGGRAAAPGISSGAELRAPRSIAPI